MGRISERSAKEGTKWVTCVCEGDSSKKAKERPYKTNRTKPATEGKGGGGCRGGGAAVSQDYMGPTETHQNSRMVNFWGAVALGPGKKCNANPLAQKSLTKCPWEEEENTASKNLTSSKGVLVRQGDGRPGRVGKGGWEEGGRGEGE